ncbi:MAG: site-2 protease family protein, partial [Nanoarchaeota archaeon]|nr:site-2 protease family protein [Nanoarchaeota archaeon]
MFYVSELIDLVIMTLAIGYIYSGFIKRKPHEGYDPIEYYKKPSQWEEVKLGIMIAAPAVVLHELSHKFVAMGFGAVAILGAPLQWYAFAILLRLINSPILFLVGGYVSIRTPLPPLESAAVSIAGPLMNFIIYGIIYAMLKNRKIKKKH